MHPKSKASNWAHARNRQDIIIRGFKTCYMSNAKWLKVLTCLAAHEGLSYDAKVKLVWDPEARNIRLGPETTYGFDFYDHAMEAMISGQPTGWYHYREIQWMDFHAAEEVLNTLEQILVAAGQLAVVHSPGCLRILGYE